MKTSCKILFCLLLSLCFVQTRVRLENDKTTIGSFKSAISFCIDPFGNYYVLDNETNSLIKLSHDGTAIGKVGGYGWASTAFDNPKDISTYNGIDFYVADYGNNRIQRLDRNLNFVSTLLSNDDTNLHERFAYPRSIAISRHGDLFLADGENERVLKINSSNKAELSLGDKGAGVGSLNSPIKVRVSRNDLVYVQDKNVLVVYDIFGNYIKTIGKDLIRHFATFSVSDDRLYIADSCTILILDEKGKEEKKNYPSFDSSVVKCPIVDLCIYHDTLFILTKHYITFMDIIK